MGIAQGWDQEIQKAGKPMTGFSGKKLNGPASLLLLMSLAATGFFSFMAVDFRFSLLFYARHSSDILSNEVC